jgi:REP element-mobilizing transposase RayT
MVATVYRRRLPHVRIDGAVYFVTWRVRIGQADLTEDERDCTATAIRHFDTVRYVLHAYVVMNDHVHVLVRLVPGYRLEEILQSWKSFTANRMQRDHGRLGSIWQDEYLDRVVRDGDEYEQKRDYILHKSRKRWPNIESYRWEWAIGTDRPIRP